MSQPYSRVLWQRRPPSLGHDDSVAERAVRPEGDVLLQGAVSTRRAGPRVLGVHDGPPGHRAAGELGAATGAGAQPAAIKGETVEGKNQFQLHTCFPGTIKVDRIFNKV